jgi:hypothetical protein
LPVMGRGTVELYRYILIEIGCSWSLAFLYRICSQLGESKIFVVAPESKFILRFRRHKNTLVCLGHLRRG